MGVTFPKYAELVFVLLVFEEEDTGFEEEDTGFEEEDTGFEEEDTGFEEEEAGCEEDEAGFDDETVCVDDAADEAAVLLTFEDETAATTDAVPDVGFCDCDTGFFDDAPAVTPDEMLSCSEESCIKSELSSDKDSDEPSEI